MNPRLVIDLCRAVGLPLKLDLATRNGKVLARRGQVVNLFIIYKAEQHRLEEQLLKAVFPEPAWAIADQ